MRRRSNILRLPDKSELSHRDVIALLQQRARELGSQKALAEELRISKQYLGDILNKRRGLSKTMLEKLGLHKRVTLFYIRESA